MIFLYLSVLLVRTDTSLVQMTLLSTTFSALITIDTNTNQFIKVYHILDKMQYKITKIFKVMKRPSYGDNLTSYLANET